MHANTSSKCDSPRLDRGVHRATRNKISGFAWAPRSSRGESGWETHHYHRFRRHRSNSRQWQIEISWPKGPGAGP